MSQPERLYRCPSCNSCWVNELGVTYPCGVTFKHYSYPEVPEGLPDKGKHIRLRCCRCQRVWLEPATPQQGEVPDA